MLGEKIQQVKEVREKISSTDGSFRQVAEELSVASTAYNESNIEFIRQQNKVNALQRELSFREKQLEESHAGLVNNRRTVEESKEEIKLIHDAVDQLEKELLKGYEIKKEKESSLTDAEQNYFKARGGINELEDSLRKLNKTRTDTQILINQMKDKFNDIKFEISSIAQRLRIEFEININDVINKEPEAQLSQEELEVKVDRMKHRLDNYGEINPMAVEAYDEMKERHENISKQKDDIVKA